MTREPLLDYAGDQVEASEHHQVAPSFPKLSALAPPPSIFHPDQKEAQHDLIGNPLSRERPGAAAGRTARNHYGHCYGAALPQQYPSAGGKYASAVPGHVLAHRSPAEPAQYSAGSRGTPWHLRPSTRPGRQARAGGLYPDPGGLDLVRGYQ